VTLEKSRRVCLLRCHLEIVSNVSMYQRMSSASVTGLCCLRPGTPMDWADAKRKLRR
jgi:hypothetical protein